jgi:hypothetical protein
MITGNHFHEIGVTGKQTSALFSATSCRSTFRGNVAYNGPRCGNAGDLHHFLMRPNDRLPRQARDERVGKLRQKRRFRRAGINLNDAFCRAKKRSFLARI